MIKTSISYLLLSLAALVPAAAQTDGEPTAVKRGERVTLQAPDGYSSYSWQVSTNGGKSFINLPGASAQTAQVSIYVPAIYRVAAVSADGKTEYPAQSAYTTEAIKYVGKGSTAPASHGYVETTDGQPGASGISIPGAERDANGLPTYTAKLTNWTSAKAQAVYYFHHPRATVDTRMVLTARSGATLSFRLRVIDPTAPATPLAETYLTARGTGRADTIAIVGLDIPAAGYYRYELQCLSGNTAITNIDRFIFSSPSATKSYAANYLSSPSVHLNSWRSTKAGAPTGAAYDWCYQEVMLPAESDIAGTYVMSLGVLKGYMGIQMNGYGTDGKSLHEVIFSMWDDGSTDEDPNLPEYLRAGAVDWSENTTVSRFGNEGTGVKTFNHGHHWECGTFVQFITNSRIEEAEYTVVENGKEVVKHQTNTLVSAWFNAQDGKGWQYIATTRLPNGKKLFDSWYSFLENYNWPTGQASRKAYYRNGYARDAATGKWYHFNAVGFGHTDGGTKTGARNDWGQGTTTDYPQTFFMQTGGYTPTDVTQSTVSLNTVDTPVDTISIDALLNRVDEAVANEKKRVEDEALFDAKNLYDKAGWKVISFSSQETSGEGSNGRAAQIIDGNVNTYWHSQWQGGAAQYPHEFIIDTQAEIPVAGFKITMSGGSNRYIKAFDLYTSNDNETWTKAYTTEEAPNQASFNVLLPEPAPLRYFRLVVRSGRANDGPFVRINEIDLAKPDATTGITSASADKGTGIGALTVSRAADGTLTVIAPSSSKTLILTVTDAQGRLLHHSTHSDITAGEAIALPAPATNGVCVVAAKAAGRIYGGAIALN